MAALQDNGCRGNDDLVAAYPPQPAQGGSDGDASLYERLFGPALRHRASRDDSADDEPSPGQGQPQDGALSRASVPQGNLRTLCVRTCDGYFFPISDHASPQDFARDQQSCEQRCPGAKVELYYHLFPGQEPREMVSATDGTPYTDLANAFRYTRDRYVAARSNAAAASIGTGNFTIIGGEPPADDGAGRHRTRARPAPKPEARPDPAEDPEMLANREGGLDRAALAGLLGTRARSRSAGTAADGKRTIRVVGPAFLPDPEASNRSAKSGPEGRPVSASLSGANSALPFRPVRCFTRSSQFPAQSRGSRARRGSRSSAARTKARSSSLEFARQAPALA